MFLGLALFVGAVALLEAVTRGQVRRPARRGDTRHIG